MSIKVEGTPDGAWVVRFIDKVVDGSETKNFKVWWSRVDESDSTKDLEYFLFPRSSAEGVIPVGISPTISVGDIFVDGQYSRKIKTLELKGFFNISVKTSHVQCINRAKRFKLTELLSSYTYELLKLLGRNGLRFTLSDSRALIDFSNAHFSFIANDSGTILVPQYPIFQTFYGINDSLAHALTSQPWRNSKNDLISIDESERLSTSEIFLKLRRKTKPQYLDYLAYYCFISPGPKYAAFIYSEISSQEDKEPYLISPFPFDSEVVELGMKTIQLQKSPPVYLCLSINEFSWPLKWCDVMWRSEADPRKGKKITEDLKPPMFPKMNGCFRGFRKPAIIETSENPDHTDQEEEILGHIVRRKNEPMIKRLKKEVSHKYEPKRRIRKHSDKTKLSAGPPGAGGKNSSSAKGTCTVDLGSRSRFDLVYDLFQLLKNNTDTVVDFYVDERPVLVSEELYTWRSYYVWPVSHEGVHDKGWTRMGSKLKGQTRCMFIINFTVKGGQHALWVELDVKNDTYCSLVMEYPDEPTKNRILDTLPAYASACEGRWPRSMFKFAVENKSGERNGGEETTVDIKTHRIQHNWLPQEKNHEIRYESVESKLIRVLNL